jgi:hypothetical protein
MLQDLEQTMRQEGDADAHRQAYNAAFDELGLNWHWDAVTFASLPAQGPERVRGYLEREQGHLLRAYDADFLVNAIEEAKSRCHAVMMRRRSGPPTHIGRAAAMPAQASA